MQQKNNNTKYQWLWLEINHQKKKTKNNFHN